MGKIKNQLNRASVGKQANKLPDSGRLTLTSLRAITIHRREGFSGNALAQSIKTIPIMKSFVQYSPDSDFPIENLPYGVFSATNNVSNPISVVYHKHR